MRKSILSAAVFGLLVSALPLKADFLLWIDKPKERTNPNDQKSKFWIPTSVPGPVGTATFTLTASPTRTNTAVDTATNTPSVTPTGTPTQTNVFTATNTPTASPTATPSLVVSATDTPTASPTATPSLVVTATDTPTSTPSYSPSATPTTGVPPSSGWPVFYDDSTGGVTNAFAAGNGGISEVGTGGDPGSYASVTIAALAYVGAVVFHNGFSAPNVPILDSATPLSSVALSLRVPSAGGNCYPPAIGLRVFPGGGGTGYNTKKVAVRDYLVGSTDLYLTEDQWYQVSIPLAAFLGYNAQPAPEDLTITAGDLDYVHGVYVEPFAYGPDTNFTGAVDVDNVRLTYLEPNPLATTKRSLAADFEYGDGQSVWNSYWSANIDAFACSSVNTALTFPPMGQTSVQDAGGNTSGSACHAGRIYGTLGTANGGYEGGGSTCTPANNEFAFLNMSMNFDPASTTTTPISKDISDASFIGNLPSGAQGLSIWLKRNAVANEAPVMKVFIERIGAKEGTQYMFLVLTSEIPTTEFKEFRVDFPWDASNSTVGIGDQWMGSAAANIIGPGQAPGPGGTELHSDAGDPAAAAAMTSSELWWGQPWWLSPNPRTSWSRTDVFQVGVGAITRGMAIDIYVDDVQFY